MGWKKYLSWLPGQRAKQHTSESAADHTVSIEALLQSEVPPQSHLENIPVRSLLEMLTETLNQANELQQSYDRNDRSGWSDDPQFIAKLNELRGQAPEEMFRHFVADMLDPELIGSALSDDGQPNPTKIDYIHAQTGNPDHLPAVSATKKAVHRGLRNHNFWDAGLLVETTGISVYGFANWPTSASVAAAIAEFTVLATSYTLARRVLRSDRQKLPVLKNAEAINAALDSDRTQLQAVHGQVGEIIDELSKRASNRSTGERPHPRLAHTLRMMRSLIGDPALTTTQLASEDGQSVNDAWNVAATVLGFGLLDKQQILEILERNGVSDEQSSRMLKGIVIPADAVPGLNSLRSSRFMAPISSSSDKGPLLVERSQDRGIADPGNDSFTAVPLTPVVREIMFEVAVQHAAEQSQTRDF